MSSNRRQHPRVAARGIAAHLQTPGGVVTCQVENISQGGIFVRTAALLPIGTTVSLSLVRPGFKKALRLTGEVVSALATAQLVGMGFQFISVSEDEGQRLASVLGELGAELGSTSVAPGASAPFASSAPAPAAPAPAAPAPAAPAPAPAAPAPAAPAPAPAAPAPAPAAPAPAAPAPAAPAPAALVSGDWSNDIPGAAPPTPDVETRRLMMQIQGLLMQLGETHAKLDEKTREVEALRAELEALRK